MQLAQRKNPTSFIYSGVGNLSDFAVVKRVRKFGGCLLYNNIFFL